VHFYTFFTEKNAVCTTRDGNVLAFGNKYDGNGDVSTFSGHTAHQWTPFQVAIPEPIFEIQAGTGFPLARTPTGRVYSWGKQRCNGYSYPRFVARCGRSHSC
jgi:alpha-tubulin suppressor-like RCC1 family protein